jgi:hypothetical protein
MKNFNKLLKTLIATILLMSSNVNAADYYWIGGTGNWNQISHWGTSSGSGPTHLTPPTLNDNVYFDANSGFSPGNSTVTMNAIGNCRSMIWSGGWATNPTLNGTFALNIYGGLEFHVNMTYSYTGAISFLATTGAWDISMGNRQVGNTFTFGGNGGTWNLRDSLATTNNIAHTFGSINTNNHNVRCQEWGSYNTNTRSVNWGSSTVRIFNRLYANRTNYTWTPGTASFFFNGTQGIVPNTGALAIFTFYNLYQTNTTATLVYPSMTVLNEARFNSNVTFNTTNVRNFNNLYLTAGKTYIFNNNSVTNISGNIILLGTPGCTSVTNIRSLTGGSAATLSKPTGSIVLNYLQMQDMTASGGATFTANNSINAGNNSGWTINSITPRTLYWVGGSGNWNDDSHWSLSSGGIGGNCQPNFQDDVFFNSASGFSAGNSTVTVNVAASCRSMTWSGGWATNPILNGSSSLNIFGSLTLHPNMTYSYTGGIAFSASSGTWNITMGNRQVGNQVTFNGNGGGWSLQDSLATTSNIAHEFGTITTNGNNVRCQEWGSYNTNVRSVNWGSSIVRIYNRLYANKTNYTWNYGTASFNFYGTQGVVPNTGALAAFTYYNLYTIPTTGTIAFPSVNVLNEAFFNNSVSFNVASSFNKLGISSGKIYSFSTSGTTTITGDVIQIGPADCSNYTSLRSITSGSQTTISKASGSVVLNNMQIRDVNATGGASFTADNSVDQGNNSGWTINTFGSRNLYWVGGSGNWNDQNHWSLTSGGAGGQCTPTFNDDVTFDAGSGFSPGNLTVTINVAANCRNMTWTGTWANNPTVAGASTLSVFGSLLFHQNMTFSYSGGIFLDATSGSWNVRMGNRQVSNNITFRGNGGTWGLLDSLATTSNIAHDNGNINTNNQNVRCQEWGSYNTNIRSISWGNSIVRIYNRLYANNNNYTWNYGTASFYFYGTQGVVPGTSAIAAFTFYNLYSINASATNTFPYLTVLNDAEFYGSTVFNGTTSFNNLKLFASKTYRFGSTFNTTISGEYIGSGNPCEPIYLFSTTAGQQGTIVIPISNTFSSDFANIQDLAATGGTYYAGGNSSDYGNNSGWDFNYAPGYVFGLGDDPEMECDSYPYLLTTENFNYTPATTFLWNDSSTEPELLALDTGWYHVLVTYSIGCDILDSIYLGEPIEPCDGIMWVGGAGVGAERTDWNNANNWLPVGVPANGTDVNIPNTTYKPTITGLSPIVNNINISASAIVTIASDGALTVDGILNNNGSLRVNSGGSLVQGVNSTISGTGGYIVRRQGHSNWQYYNYWSSSVQSSTVNILGGNRYYFDPTTSTVTSADDEFDPGWITASGTMNPGIGYASTGAGLVSFSGAINNYPTSSPLNVSVTRATVVDGEVGTNLIGNPFPSAISITNFLTNNSSEIDGSVYFWNQQTLPPFTSADYTTVNAAGYVSGPNNQPNYTTIPSGQGFFVIKSTLGTGNVQFRNSQRVAGNNAHFYDVSDISRLWLSVISPQMKYNETLIAFKEDATVGVDNLYDSKKLSGNNYAIAIHSFIEDKQYAIQTLPRLEQHQTVQLGVLSSETGSFIIALKNMEQFAPGTIVVLEDTKLNVFHNLTIEEQYVYEKESDDAEQRFRIHFYAAPVIAAIATCTENSGKISVNNPSSQIWTVTLENEAGAIVGQQGLNGAAALSFENLSVGNYKMKFVNSSGFQFETFETITSDEAADATFEIENAQNGFLPYESITAHVKNPKANATYEWYLNELFAGTGNSVSFAISDAGSYNLRLDAGLGNCLSTSLNSFSVETTTSTSNIKDDNLLRAYPNPANEMVTLVWNDNSHIFETVRITDISGRTIRIVQIGGRQQGNQVQLDLIDISEGIYLINLEGKEVRRVVKVSVVK